MGLYTIELYNPAGDLLADISELCLTRTFQVRRNRPEDIYLTLNLEKAQQLASNLGMSFNALYAPGINEVRISRGNRALVGGQLSYVVPRLNREGATLEMRASGFLSLLKQLYFDDHAIFLNTDMGLVAWQTILVTDADGNFGISQGDIQTSRSITEAYQPYSSSAAEVLIGLTERLDGIDFEFTPDKVFNVYYPGIGSDKTELLFSYPGNITSIALPRDATTLVNASINRGQGNGDAQLIETREDSNSITTYKRRERIDDFPSVTSTTTLQEKGDETLRLYANPTTIPEVTLDGSMEPYLGSYWIGDRVRFSVDTDRYPAFSLIDGQTWRINEIICSIDENDHEEITLKVGYA